MNRRDVILKIFSGGAILALSPTIITACKKVVDPDNNNNNNNNGSGTITIDLTDPQYSGLNTAGGSILKQGIIIANTGNNVFIALDSTCTHQGCTIAYNAAANNFPCPCHGSVYSTTGSVITGPAPLPVQSYQVTKSGNVLTIIVG